MKRLLLLTLLPFNAMAAPFLVSDPAPTGQSIDQCIYQDGTAASVTTPLATYTGYSGPGCKIDLGTFAAGTHNLQVWFASSLWGTASAKIPFALNVPATGGAGPANLIIKP